MRQFISTEKKDSNILAVGVGYALIAIIGYAVYRFIGFIISQIDLPANITNLGFVAVIIIVTLGATSLLLRADMKSVRKKTRILHKSHAS